MIKDEKAILFNTVTRTRFPVVESDYAIGWYKDFGPVFGDAELAIR